jgi:hypothetical protein
MLPKLTRIYSHSTSFELSNHGVSHFDSCGFMAIILCGVEITLTSTMLN